MPYARTDTPRALLFDLDGTFADTAPDLAAALNRLRREHDLLPVAAEVLRPHTSHGVRGMLGAGMSVAPGDPDYAPLRARFLDHYAAALCVHTRVFDGIATLVAEIEAAGGQWGIVTNKQHRYTLPLLDALGFRRRAGCIVSGDSSPRSKPHAEPLRLTAALIRVAPEDCLYAGDDHRDIVAGRAAGMRTVAVRYGYLGSDEPIERWGADQIVEQPADLLPLVLR